MTYKLIFFFLMTIARFFHKNMPAQILTVFVFFSAPTLAEPIRDHQTTRLKATAGTGVGSFLMDEATILNPASLGFFNISSIYYQRNKGDITAPEGLEGRSSNYTDTAIIASDAKGDTGGSFSYINQKRGPERRKSLSVSMAKPFRKKSALGVTYRRISDKNLVENSFDTTSSERYNEFSVGVIHALNEFFSIGILVDDPFKSRTDSTFATIGFQYLFHDYIVLMFDVGSDYTRDLGDTSAYRGAIQVMFYNDFFLRAGFFKDNGKSETGNGMGLGWVGPRLLAEFAIQNIDIDSREQPFRSAQDIKETSFSIAFKF